MRRLILAGNDRLDGAPGRTGTSNDESRGLERPGDFHAPIEVHHGCRGGDAGGQIELPSHGRPMDLCENCLSRRPSQQWRVRHSFRRPSAAGTESERYRLQRNPRHRGEGILCILRSSACELAGFQARRHNHVLSGSEGAARAGTRRANRRFGRPLLPDGELSPAERDDSSFGAAHETHEIGCT